MPHALRAAGQKTSSSNGCRSSLTRSPAGHTRCSVPGQQHPHIAMVLRSKRALIAERLTLYEVYVVECCAHSATRTGGIQTACRSWRQQVVSAKVLQTSCCRSQVDAVRLLEMLPGLLTARKDYGVYRERMGARPGSSHTRHRSFCTELAEQHRWFLSWCGLGRREH